MLTQREQSVLDFITDYIGRSGVGPTLQEIGDGLGLKSRGTVHRYVEALKAKKQLQRTGNGWRDIRLPRKRVRSDGSLPLRGTISTGRGIERYANEVNFSQMLGGTQRYVLRIADNSMVNAGILDGDLIVIRKTGEASDGDIVLARIDNEEITLKRMRAHGDRIELIPDNAESTSMIYPTSRVHIQGVVVGQVRLY